MNVIRFLLGVTTVVALTGFAPEFSIAEELNKVQTKYTLTPALFERGESFSHDSFIQLERTVEFQQGASYLNCGVRFLDHFRLVYGGDNTPHDLKGDKAEFQSFFSPIVEIGRRLDFAPRSVVALYGCYGWPASDRDEVYPAESYVDLGLTVRSGWGAIKAGVFRSKRPTYHRENDRLDWIIDGGPYQGTPITAYYISFGVGPSFRF